ncbi:hypothetical protein [Congregibacter litoralis]|uniref:Uncharacterized protein n=1 Tax=Congregibacter litoralis KT71 TaxID=314285 RepID=A4A4N8_9GAMM|nr:hypothetical protein [Congregibacter litoralis]EAQ98759.1 hypothetical protein KT71_09037 [Congregibacter litoralis KT71]
MRSVAAFLLVLLVAQHGNAHHGEQLYVGVYQRTAKLSAFIPSCGHDRWDVPRGSFFVIANPDVVEVLEHGYWSEEDTILKHVAVDGVFLDEAKVGYDGVMFLTKASEIDVGGKSAHGVSVPCT